MSRPPLGFIPDPLTLPLDRILPSRKTPEGLHTSRKFKQIMASMEATTSLLMSVVCARACWARVCTARLRFSRVARGRSCR